MFSVHSTALRRGASSSVASAVASANFLDETASDAGDDNEMNSAEHNLKSAENEVDSDINAGNSDDDEL